MTLMRYFTEAGGRPETGPRARRKKICIGCGCLIVTNGKRCLPCVDEREEERRAAYNQTRKAARP